MKLQLGIEKLLKDPKLKERLKGKRVALLGHPASVVNGVEHSIDALISAGIPIVSAFGPQHGMKGEKQDNMIESDDDLDPLYKIPVFSLYGKVRRPTPDMLSTFDVLLVDLQDVGCRIYTFLTTLFYLLEDCSQNSSQSIWVLDRPNPAGRPIEGNKLNMEFKSFVGAAPVPMRHGLTLGEAALWYKNYARLDVNLEVIKMEGYSPDLAPDLGWPGSDIPWVNPSPNMPRLSTARVYAGTVLIEGSQISEGRGTTRPLEIFGAPGLNSNDIIRWMTNFQPEWLKGCKLRSAFYEPTFHKFKGQLVSAVQIHVDPIFYKHNIFKPYRLVASYFKAVKSLNPEFQMWISPPYEYEKTKMPIDILSGDSFLRTWVEDSQSQPHDLEKHLVQDEQDWIEERRPFLLY